MSRWYFCAIISSAASSSSFACFSFCEGDRFWSIRFLSGPRKSTKSFRERARHTQRLVAVTVAARTSSDRSAFSPKKSPAAPVPMSWCTSPSNLEYLIVPLSKR
jgi:hypothetical protein